MREAESRAPRGRSAGHGRQRGGLDVGRARAETPGAGRVVHLNNAGAALMPSPVLDAMTGHLRLEAEIGGYEAAERAASALDATYSAAARLLHCHPEEVALTDSATRAWTMAFASVPMEPGDRILTSSVEYGSNQLALTQTTQRTGASVEVIPNDETGRVDVEALRHSIDENVRLIVMTHVPTHGGTINPVVEVGKIASEAQVLYLVDACQSVGQLPVDVRAIDCDFLVACGRKYLRGPRGTGLLYCRRESVGRIDPPLVGLDGARWTAAGRFDYAPAARRFETWETNAAAKLGLGAAIEYALDWSIEETAARTVRLAAYLRSALAAVPGTKVLDRGPDLCGLVGFAVRDRDHGAVREALLARGVNVWNCLASTAPVDMAERGLPSVLRASVHYYNTTAEVDTFCAQLTEVIAG